MKKSLVLGMLGASLVLSGCSSKDDVPKTGSPATKISSIHLAKQQTLETDAKTLGLEYLPEVGEFSSNSSMIRPCENSLPKKLADLEKAYAAIKASLDADSKAAEFKVGREGYTEKALQFYSKVEYQTESLGQITSSLSAFCEKDQAKIAACLGSGEQVRVLINPIDAGFMNVHPLMLLQPTSKFAIYSTDNRGDEIRALNVADSERPDGFEFHDFMQTTSLAEIQALTQCLDSAQLNSLVGLQLLDTAHLASVESSIECRDAKPEVLFCSLD